MPYRCHGRDFLLCAPCQWDLLYCHGTHTKEYCWVTLQNNYTNLNELSCILLLCKFSVLGNKVAKTWWLQGEKLLSLKSRCWQRTALDNCLGLTLASAACHSPWGAQAYRRLAPGSRPSLPCLSSLHLSSVRVCLWIQTSLSYEDTSHTGRGPP